MATENEELVLSISADTRQIMNAMKRLTAEIAKSTSGIQKQFDSVGRGVDKSMTTAMQRRIDSMVGIQSTATKEWTGVLAEQGKEMERLRSRFNPLFSTVNRYKTTIGEIRAAHRLGAISSDEMTAAIQRERTAALSSIAAIKQRNAALSDTPVVRSNTGGSFNTANIAAQFQDIGVTTAMGMNPMTIALQQGTQLSAVFEQMKANGQSAGQAIVAAFQSVISPMSLVTIGVVAAGAAIAQYAMSGGKEVETLDEMIKRHEENIRRLGPAYENALVAAVKYSASPEVAKAVFDVNARELEDRLASATKEAVESIKATVESSVQSALGTTTAQTLQEAYSESQFKPFEDAIRRLDEGAISAREFSDEIYLIAQQAPAFAAAGRELQTLVAPVVEIAKKADEASQPIDDLQVSVNALAEKIGTVRSAKAQEELNGLMEKASESGTATDELNAALARISGYAPDLTSAIAAFQELFKAVNDARSAAVGFTGRESQGGRTRYGGSGFMQLPGEVGVTPERRVDPYFQDWRTKTSGGKSKEATEAERAKKAIDDVVASLKFEQEQLGRTGTQQRVYNELKRAGVDITSESGRQIASLVTSFEAERQAMEKNKQALEARAKSIEHLFSMGSDAIGDIIDKSASAEDAVKKLAAQLALAAAQAALFGSGPLAGLFGKGLGLNNTTNFIDGRGGGLAALLGQGFATGTANTGGQRGKPRGIVHGQEAVIPLPNGGKVPVQIQAPVAPRLATAERPNDVAYNDNRAITIDARGAQQGVGAEIRQALEEYDREVLPLRFNAIARDPRARG